MKKLIAISLLLGNAFSYSMNRIPEVNVRNQLNKPAIVPQQFVINMMTLQLEGNQFQYQKNRKIEYSSAAQQKTDKRVNKQHNRIIQQPQSRRANNKRKK